jgi:hypothetical protein
MSLPAEFKVVEATLGPVTTNGGITLDNISLKLAHKAWLVVSLKQAAGHATAITPLCGTAVATCSTALPVNAKIWANEDVAASDTLVVKTAGVAYTVTNDIKAKTVIIEIDPATLADTYDCVGGTIGDSSQATNFASALWIIQPRYKSPIAIPFITD